MNASIELSAEALEAIAQRVAEILIERMPPVNISPYLTVAEAADYLRCKPQRIYDLRSAGVLAKHGRLVARAELDALLLPSHAGSANGNGVRR
jgi:hypothetical protein